jgi:nucleoside-diphosphate-sugar epimerase
MEVLVTGDRGFIGSHLVSRCDKYFLKTLPEYIRLGPESEHDSRIGYLMESGSVVIHLAGLAHEHYSDDQLFSINHEGTLALARLSASRRVSRFIYLSTVSVYGDGPHAERYTENSALPENTGCYSRFETEVALIQLSIATDMELVIIRSPLVYGPGVKANFFSLLTIACKSFPLPFGSVNNRRSMIYVGNLVDFIFKCIDHPAAINQIFLVSDGEDVSLRSLITLIRSEFGNSSRLLPIPIALFKLVGICSGKKHVIDRLVGDLQVDSSKSRNLLGWVPPYSVEEGIAATVQDFKNRNK